MIQPGGTCSPRLRARLIFPAATALVAMSIRTGPSRSLGMPMQMGLVPNLRARPPKGTTAFGPAPESAVTNAIMPSSSAMVG